MKQGELIFLGQSAFTTFALTAGAVVGDAVAHTGAASAGRGKDGDPLLGKLLTLEAPDGVGAVAHTNAGFVDLPTVGTLPTGFQTLVVDGQGRAKVGASGTRVLVNIARDGVANVLL